MARQFLEQRDLLAHVESFDGFSDSLDGAHAELLTSWHCNSSAIGSEVGELPALQKMLAAPFDEPEQGFIATGRDAAFSILFAAPDLS